MSMVHKTTFIFLRHNQACLFLLGIFQLYKAITFRIKRQSLLLSQVAHQAEAYTCISFVDGMLVNHRDTPGIKFTSTHLFTQVERGIIKVKFLAQQHNALPRPGLEPRPLDPESSTSHSNR